MEGFAIGERSGIEDGRLSLYVAQRPGRLRLLLLALRALVGRLRQARDFDAMLATEIAVQSRRRRLRVATDGEVTVMTPPLEYRIRPASLLVVRPRAARRDDLIEPRRCEPSSIFPTCTSAAPTRPSSSRCSRRSVPRGPTSSSSRAT